MVDLRALNATDLADLLTWSQATAHSATQSPASSSSLTRMLKAFLKTEGSWKKKKWFGCLNVLSNQLHPAPQLTSERTLRARCARPAQLTLQTTTGLIVYTGKTKQFLNTQHAISSSFVTTFFFFFLILGQISLSTDYSCPSSTAKNLEGDTESCSLEVVGGSQKVTFVLLLYQVSSILTN